MGEPFFQPWISDKEPKAPDGWGIDGFHGTAPLICSACFKELEVRDQYLYTFSAIHAIILHNTKECWDRYKQEQLQFEQDQERLREYNE